MVGSLDKKIHIVSSLLSDKKIGSRLTSTDKKIHDGSHSQIR